MNKDLTPIEALQKIYAMVERGDGWAEVSQFIYFQVPAIIERAKENEEQ